MNTATRDSEQAHSPEDSSKEQGLYLFNLQKQRLEVEYTKKRSESILVMEDIAADPTISTTKKAVFAETMREVSRPLASTYSHLVTYAGIQVEQEKLLASEERFKWERERRKLEEERQKFEEEKKILEQEIQQMRLQT